jgi:transcription elongation GreA/GreB family factor
MVKKQVDSLSPPAEAVAAPEEAAVAISRNEIIKALLSEGKVPLLPFEHALLGEQLEQHTADQKVLGRLIFEAMEQSSETWHDNAPADAINHESRTLSKRADVTLSALRDGEALPYPTEEDPRVTLGSLVGIEFSAGEDIEYVLLTGFCREIPTEFQQHLPADTAPITINSPLGGALFDAAPEDAVSYTLANGRSVTVRVAKLHQFSPDTIN